ncbi:MAG: alpha/beta hydrolase [Pseudomonadota bacterium]
MTQAPFDNDLAQGPPDGRAFWLKTADGTRIRAGFWPAAAPQGTIFLLPGRTEYIEKYGRTAADFAKAGFGTLSLDWRGQGRSDRALNDPLVGHVTDFADYQDDLDTLLAFAQAQALPQPYFLLAHSMGGAIGLRALIRGLPFDAAAFCAPMWGILLSAWTRPLANILSAASRYLAFDHLYAPGTGAKPYVLAVPFALNRMTRDADHWEYMRAQAVAHPDMSLGGPSFGWLRAALAECHALQSIPAPALPCLCALGSLERIVDTAPIHARMRLWKTARLTVFAGTEHEILMERPIPRAAFIADCVNLFQSQTPSPR